MSKNTSLSDVLRPMQDDIQPLNMNGLEGRMLRIESENKRHKKHEILLIYGSHASIERMYGLAKYFSRFGTVTMPDLPGFGGMESLSKHGVEPTIDALADYLAAFVKLRYKRKKVTLIGMSLGFVIITRMLQRYPELNKKVALCVSLAGFSHNHDFVMSKTDKNRLKSATRIFDKKLPAWLFYNIALHPLAIKTVYTRRKNARKKLDHLELDQRGVAVDFEVKLWRENDVRTYMKTSRAMLELDNSGVQVPLTVHHVTVDNDQYFDRERVEQHMRIIFDDYVEHRASMPNHAPSIIADPQEASCLVPKSLQTVLRRAIKGL